MEFDYYMVVSELLIFQVKTEKPNATLDTSKYNLLYSILYYWNEGSGCFINTYVKEFSRAKKLIIDSGGFNILKVHPDYPFTVKAYNDKVNQIHPDYAASMDYNLYALRNFIGDTFKDRKPYMIKTIDNFVEQYDMERNFKLLFPIQGNDLEERLIFLDWASERMDLQKVKYWAIGGIVGTYDYQLVSDITMHMKHKFNKPYIHLFGGNVKWLKNLLNYDVHFTSIDTWSWGIPIKVGFTYKEDLSTPVRIRKTNLTSRESKNRCFLAYDKRLSELQQQYANVNDNTFF